MRRLIYLHQYFKFPSEQGGTRSYDLARSFVRKGYRVEIVSSTSDVKYRNEKKWTSVEKEGFIVHYVYLPYDNKMSYGKRMGVFFQFIFYATKKLVSLKGDVVLATSTPLTIGIPALVKKWKHKTPYVFEVRDVWPEAVIAIGAIKNKIVQKILYKLEEVIYKNASAIVPLSTDMKDSIVSRYPDICKDKPMSVIENLSEIDRFRPSVNIDIIRQTIGFKPRYTILYAGTFGRVNGIDYVVHLAEELIEIDPSIVFVLIGNGALKDSIIESAKAKDLLNKNIFILPPVPKEELPIWYASADMGSSFVVPIKELWANSANKFFDSLAAGKPVLINYKGWQSDVIENDNVGYVLPEKLSKDSVRTFVSYTQNRELYSEQSKNALKKAIESYSLDVAVNKYINLFKSIKHV